MGGLFLEKLSPVARDSPEAKVHRCMEQEAMAAYRKRRDFRGVWGHTPANTLSQWRG